MIFYFYFFKIINRMGSSDSHFGFCSKI